MQFKIRSMSRNKSVNFVVRFFLMWMIFNHDAVYGDVELSINSNIFYLSDYFFEKFFNCMLEHYWKCIVTSTNENNEYVISRLGYTMTGTYYYNCTSGYGIISCLRTWKPCFYFFSNCVSYTAGIMALDNNMDMSGDGIMSCSPWCYEESLTFYYRVPATTTTTTRQTTTKKPTSSTLITTLSTTSSVNTIHFQIISTTKSVFINSTVNASSLILNNDKTDSHSSTTVTIIGCVVGVAMFVACIVIGLLLWRKYRKNTAGNYNDKSVEKCNYYVNNQSAQNNHGNVPVSDVNEFVINQPYLIKTGRKRNIKEYSNCVVEGDYTIIAEGENNAALQNCPDSEKNVETKLTETLNKTSTYKERKYNTDDGIKHIANDISSKISDANMYFNTVEKSNNDYQRLGQERRDLKNPYQQLLQVEQEQQLVLSDQELSPYTLAKPVLGAATLQIIDVGTWVDNSSSIERTKEDQPYNNTLQDVFTPHEPTVDIKHGSLDYTVVMHKQ